MRWQIRMGQPAAGDAVREDATPSVNGAEERVAEEHVPVTEGSARLPDDDSAVEPAALTAPKPVMDAGTAAAIRPAVSRRDRWRRTRLPRPEPVARWEQVLIRYLGVFGRHNAFTLTVTGVAAMTELVLLGGYLFTHGSWPTPDVLVLALVPIALIIARPYWFVVDWGVFVGLWLAWQALADAVAPSGLEGVHFTGPINADKWLFNDLVPTIALQHAFYRPGRLAWWDWAATFVHTAHFVVPVAVAFLLWLKSRGLFWRMAAAILATSYVGLLGYWRYPAAPPWLASDQGYFAPDHVMRILGETNAHFTATVPMSWVYQQFAGNAVAAMPSLHAAMPVLVALAVWRVFPRWTPLAVMYVLAMDLSIVYLGEHYASDALAGAGIAAACFALIWPLGAAGERLWARLFPRHAPRVCPDVRGWHRPGAPVPRWWEAARAVVVPGVPLLVLLGIVWGPLGIRPVAPHNPWVTAAAAPAPSCVEQPGEALGGAEGALAPLGTPAALFVEDLTTRQCYVGDPAGIVPPGEERQMWLTSLDRAVTQDAAGVVAPVADDLTVIHRTGTPAEILGDPNAAGAHSYAVAVLIHGEANLDAVSPALLDAARIALAQLTPLEQP